MTTSRDERMELLMATPAHYWTTTARRVELPVVNDDGQLDLPALRQELALHGVNGEALALCAKEALDEGIVHIRMGMKLRDELELGLDAAPTLHIAFIPTPKSDFIGAPPLVHDYLAYWKMDWRADGRRTAVIETFCEMQNGVFYSNTAKALPLDQIGKPCDRLCPLCYAIYPVGGKYGRLCGDGYSCEICGVNPRMSHAAPRFGEGEEASRASRMRFVIGRPTRLKRQSVPSSSMEF